MPLLDLSAEADLEDFAHSASSPSARRLVCRPGSWRDLWFRSLVMRGHISLQRTRFGNLVCTKCRHAFDIFIGKSFSNRAVLWLRSGRRCRRRSSVP